MVDKNEAIIAYLITCDAIKNSSIYFNFINAKDDTKQIISDSTEVALNKTYIDGSVLKEYQCTLNDFKSLSTRPIVRSIGYSDENVVDLGTIQAIIDWLNEQDDVRNFPDFGEDCIVESIKPTSNSPNLVSIDASTTPALAKYSITIRVTYLDKSKVIWKT